MPPEQLGRYEIQEELGRGAMGIVYKARDPLIDRTVALKTVALDLSPEESDAFEQRFYREAKSAGRLSHSNIVTIHDVGKTDGVAYIAMEFVQGRSLREILDSGVVIPPARIADIVAQVADGLAFAHENGVVHRDIKPANIMVPDSGPVKIMDFGIAHLPAGSRTIAGTVFGSPKYMAPERIAGNPVDGRADIFSLGAVLYEMLTGFPPFFGGDLETLLEQVINETPAAPSSRNKTIPFSFDHIVATSMAKRPGDRYANAPEMAAAVRNFRNLRAPGAVPQGPPPSARRTGRSPEGKTAESLPKISSAASRVRALPPTEAGPTPSGQRRNLVVYGGAAALVAVLASAAVLSQRASNAPPPAPSQPDVIAGTEKAAGPNPGAAELYREESAPVKPAAPVAAVVPSETAPAVTQPPPAVAMPTARLALAVTPWGEVYVDGKRKGVAPPLTEIRVAPGKHTIEIRNTTFQSYAQAVDLAANASLKIKHKFQ